MNSHVVRRNFILVAAALLALAAFASDASAQGWWWRRTPRPTSTPAWVVTLPPTGTPTSQPTPLPTNYQTPLPTATVAPLDPLTVNFKCSATDNPSLQAAIAQLMASGRVNLANRMRQECGGYLKGSEGFGSVEQVMNQKSPEVSGKLAALNARLSARINEAYQNNTVPDMSPLTDIVPEHKLWMGEGVDDILVRMADDVADYALSLAEVDECLGLWTEGMCIDGWIGFIPIPGYNVRYRWPSQLVQAVQHKGMDGYIFNPVAEVYVDSGAPLINDDLILANTDVASKAVSAGMTSLAVQFPLAKITGAPEMPDFDYGKNRDVQNQLRAALAPLGIDNRDSRARNPQKDGITRMEFHLSRTPFESQFRTLYPAMGIWKTRLLWALGGPWHRDMPLLIPPIGGLSSSIAAYQSAYWTEGGLFPYLSVPLSRYYSANVINMPGPMASQRARPLRCMQHNKRGGDSLPRFKSTYDVVDPIYPLADGNCVDGNLGDNLALTFTHDSNDLRTAGDHALWRGLISVNQAMAIERRTMPRNSRMLSRYFYGYDTSTNSRTRLYFMHDKKQRDKWDKCSRFDRESFFYSRESGEVKLEDRDRTLNEFDPDDEGDGSWTAAHVWTPRERDCIGLIELLAALSGVGRGLAELF